MTTIPNSLRQAVTGISGILVTPFDANDKIDPERLEPVMTRAIAANVDILVVNGNTSEFYALQAAEAQAMMEAVKDMAAGRSEEHTSELQSLMRTSYAVFCLKKKIETNIQIKPHYKHKQKKD